MGVGGGGIELRPVVTVRSYGSFRAAGPRRRAVILLFCDLQVVELLSTVIEHLVRGEVIQIKHALKDTTSINEIFDVYLKKSYYKTASLMANSCKVHAHWLLSSHSFVRQRP